MRASSASTRVTPTTTMPTIATDRVSAVTAQARGSPMRSTRPVHWTIPATTIGATAMIGARRRNSARGLVSATSHPTTPSAGRSSRSATEAATSMDVDGSGTAVSGSDEAATSPWSSP